MKKLNLYFLPIAILIISSCNSNQKSSNQDTAGLADSFKTVSPKCYQAVIGQDSAFLTIKEIDGKVAGELSFNFFNKGKEDNHGTISGAFKGDTLFVDYSFILNKTTYLNPQIFLRKGTQLAQGSGELFTYLGKTTFKEGTKIDFESNFIFEPVDCK